MWAHIPISVSHHFVFRKYSDLSGKDWGGEAQSETQKDPFSGDLNSNSLRSFFFSAPPMEMDHDEEELAPDTILFSDEIQVCDAAFHPNQDVLAAGLINGGVQLYAMPPSIYLDLEHDDELSDFPSPSSFVHSIYLFSGHRFKYGRQGQPQMLFQLKYHRRSCRCLAFSHDGRCTDQFKYKHP